MQLLFSMIAMGAVTALGNQFLFLFLVGLMSRLELFVPGERFAFMGHTWFIGLMFIVWVFTSGAKNVPFIDFIVNFFSTLIIPLSAMLFTLASAGIITHMHPEMAIQIERLQIFDRQALLGLGEFGRLAVFTAMIFAVGFAFMGATVQKAAKIHTGMVWLDEIINNLMALTMVALLYVLAQINPWLAIGFVGILFLIGLYMVWLFSSRIYGFMAYIMEHPREGSLVILEFCVWGAGSYLVGWQKGWGRFPLWCGWAVLSVMIFFGTVIPCIGWILPPVMIAGFIFFGLRSARALWKYLQHTSTVPMSLA